MNHRRIVAATAAVLLNASPVLAATPSALDGLPVLAHANIDITFTSTSFSVCYDGYVDDGTGSAGTWLLQIEGARSDGSVIRQTDVELGETIGPACFPIPKNGATAGGFVATLSFATIGSGGPNAVPDFTALAGGIGAWNPNTPNNVDSFGT